MYYIVYKKTLPPSRFKLLKKKQKRGGMEGVVYIHIANISPAHAHAFFINF